MIKEGAVVKFKGYHDTIIQGVIIALWKYDRVKIIDTDDGTWVIPKKEITEVLY
jgi:hypothetical protein